MNNNIIEYRYDNILYKKPGEFLYHKAKNLYDFSQKIGFFFSFLTVLFGLFGFYSVFGFFLLISIFFTLLNLVFIFFISDEQPNKAVLGVINKARGKNTLVSSFDKKKIEYYVAMGCTVKEFLGKDEDEAVKKNLSTKSNLLYDVVFDSSTYCTGYLLPGSTGSGKTVTLYATVFLPAILSGNSFFYLEGKGDKNITSAIVSFCYQYGREQDLFIFDFGAASTGNYTNGINPLAIGNSKNVLELLKSLINIMTGDNAWVTDMNLAYMGAILQPLILLRDLNMMVEPSKLRNINSFADLSSNKIKKVNFTLSVLLKYMNYQAAIDLLYMTRRLFDDNEFVRQVRLLDEYAKLKTLRETIISQLEMNLRNANIDIDMSSEPDYSKIDPEIQKHNIKAITTWVDSLTVFASEKFYGNVFNKDVPDVDMVNALQTNKIIVFILPSMGSTDEENKKMGSMAISLVKMAIGYMIEQGGLDASRGEQARQMRFRPRKLPYAIVFDEPSNYANGDIPTMSSMVRSIGYDNGGMAIVWTGQSLGDAQKIDDGKNIKKDQLIANLGLTQCLNVQDDGYKKLMKEKIGEIKVYREDQVVGKKDKNRETSIRIEKEWKYDENYFQNNLRIKTGESIVHLKGYEVNEKMVTFYNEPPSTDFILNKFVDSRTLLNVFDDVDEAKEKIKSIKEGYNKELEKNINKEMIKQEGMNSTWRDEILKDLKKLAILYDEKIDTKFTLELISEDSKTVHGDYTPDKKRIRVFNAINKNREHLFATAVHELCHHIEFSKHGESGHGTRFYSILYDLFVIALRDEDIYFDYEDAKLAKAWDSSDIKRMEQLFGVPKR